MRLVLAGQGPKAILLVEDNPADVEFTKEALREIDALESLTVVSNGEDALSFLRREGQYASVVRPDLVILDLNLPKKSGRDVLSAIKDSSEHKSIPVVVLSSSRSDDDIATCYGLHANCYIVKPPDLHGYIDVIKSIEAFWLSTVELPRN